MIDTGLDASYVVEEILLLFPWHIVDELPDSRCEMAASDLGVQFWALSEQDSEINGH